MDEKTTSQQNELNADVWKTFLQSSDSARWCPQRRGEQADQCSAVEAVKHELRFENNLNTEELVVIKEQPECYLPGEKHLMFSHMENES